MAFGTYSKDVLTQKLEKQAVKGTVYIVGYYGISVALRMVSSVVLTRLFSPEYFGLMTLSDDVARRTQFVFAHRAGGQRHPESPRR